MDENTLQMNPQEVMRLQQLRRQTADLMHQIGQLEVQKAVKLGYISQLEAQAQQVLHDVAQRLGLPEGSQWQAAPDGTITVISKETPSQDGE